MHVTAPLLPSLKVCAFLSLSSPLVYKLITDCFSLSQWPLHPLITSSSHYPNNSCDNPENFSIIPAIINKRPLQNSYNVVCKSNFANPSDLTTSTDLMQISFKADPAPFMSSSDDLHYWTLDHYPVRVLILMILLHNMVCIFYFSLNVGSRHCLNNTFVYKASPQNCSFFFFNFFTRQGKKGGRIATFFLTCSPAPITLLDTS